MSTAAIRTGKVQPLRTPEPEAEKTSGAGLLARAVALHLAGKREEALKLLQRAVSNNEGSAEIYRAMAHIQFEMGDFKEAGKTYRTLTQVKPQYAMGWFNLAVCLERLGAWFPAPGYCDEEMIFYRVSDLRPPAPDSTHRPDEDEEITTASFTIAEARAMSRRGEIVDLKTAFALTLIGSGPDGMSGV